MENLSDLLGKYSSQEPKEITLIKRYITDNFQASSSISLRGESIIVSVSSAALANTLRLRITDLKTAAQTDKNIILRIG